MELSSVVEIGAVVPPSVVEAEAPVMRGGFKKENKFPEGSKEEASRTGWIQREGCQFLRIPVIGILVAQTGNITYEK